MNKFWICMILVLTAIILVGMSGGGCVDNLIGQGFSKDTAYHMCRP